MPKPYKTGLIVGRFQVFHLGHEQMIRKSIETCDKTLVFIGSSQESLTQKNPFSYDFRKEIISEIFSDEITSGIMKICPLQDIGVGNNGSWGNYVFSSAKKELGYYPDLLVSGKENRRVNWFEDEDIKISELYIPKSVDISATKIRESIVNGDIELWKKYTNSKLWNKYEEMRNIIIISQKNIETKSL
jgi:cytidyltransferase-like protein